MVYSGAVCWALDRSYSWLYDRIRTRKFIKPARDRKRGWYQFSYDDVEKLVLVKLLRTNPPKGAGLTLTAIKHVWDILFVEADSEGDEIQVLMDCDDEGDYDEGLFSLGIKMGKVRALAWAAWIAAKRYQYGTEDILQGVPERSQPPTLH